MAILEIKKYPDPILRKKCQEVKKITEEIKNLCQDMIETMIRKEGVGLAAPQVGQLKRIIVVKFEDGPKAFINPQILSKSKEMEVAKEGCLCLPGIRLNVKRGKSILVKAQGIEGREIEVKAEGLIARIFQHEIDHLNGVLFIDKVGLWQRLKIKKELKNIK